MTPEARASLEDIVRSELRDLPVESHDAEDGHPLVVTPYGPAEALAAIDVLLSTRVTMGEQTRAFEAEWAHWCDPTGDARHAVMVNSGSSANLLLLSGLVEIGALQKGDEVIVPAVGWSTSLFPIAQAGLVPVVVDVHPATLNLDPAAVAAARGPRTRAVLAVHLLGQPVDLDDPAFDGLIRLEDACGAHGATVRGRRVGALGDGATFSFFFSHHITTIEGGMVVTRDAALADAMRSLRAHGWVRERSDRTALAEQNPDVDPRFLFVSAGYNLRPTDLQAAFGRVQLGRLDAWVARRRANHAAWCALVGGLEGHTVFPESPGCTHAGFAFPFLLPPGRPRADAIAALAARGIETRAISAGNLVRQPAFARIDARVAGALPVADAVHSRGLFVGNSHAFTSIHGERLARALADWSAA